MICVLFEAHFKKNGKTGYLAEAEMLAGHLEGMDGFIGVERFQSLTEPGKILSRSYWRDLDSVTNWVRQEQHRQAQYKGRTLFFDRYRIQTMEIIREKVHP